MTQLLRKNRVSPGKLGIAHATITRNRTSESALANVMTDAFRHLSGAEIAMLNTGGIRDSLEAGDVTYEDLYKVFPFANRGVVVGPMEQDRLMRLLDRSIKTCGAFGALMQSGLRVVFERDCSRAVDGVDPLARLLKVETVGGEVLFDVQTETTPNACRMFQVSTLDFLASGGSGFTDFKGVPLVSDLGIVREALTTHFMANPVEFRNDLDGRWSETVPARVHSDFEEVAK